MMMIAEKEKDFSDFPFQMDEVEVKITEKIH